MAYGNSEFEDKIRKDEAERCALLAEDLAGRWERSAAKARADHTWNAGWFRVRMFTAPYWEKFARDVEAAAHGLRTVARGCREGWDTRKLEPLPCPECTAPMDCGSWQCCEKGKGDWPKGGVHFPGRDPDASEII